MGIAYFQEVWLVTQHTDVKYSFLTSAPGQKTAILWMIHIFVLSGLKAAIKIWFNCVTVGATDQSSPLAEIMAWFYV